MQEASADFDAAVAAHRTWVPPRLRTDWDGTGYDGDGTIDDLSPQMGESWQVDHTLDDGYPETVAFVSGTSVPELSTDLLGRADPATGAPITAPAYWSPMRPDSPVYGYDRDVPPVTLDVGLVTAAGREYVRVFTGQMANTPVRGGKATLETISATRLKLMKLVQPPAFSTAYAKGIYATWPISFALTQCGLHAGPQVRDETAWYAPMHGSAWAMIPAGNQVFTALDLLSGASFPQWFAYEQTPSDVSPVLIDEVDWITGPYVSAPDLELTASMRRALYVEGLKLDPDAPPALTQTSNAGRLEMWVKGDVTDVNNAPGGSGTVSRLCSLWLEAVGGGLPYARMGVTPTRNVQVSVWDGSAVRTLTSATTLPTDGTWYFVGAGYDIAADRLWVNIGGTVTASTASMLSGNLPDGDVDEFNDGFPVFLSVLPVAEVTFTTGVEANADNYPLWRDDASFAPTATVYPSSIKLNVIAETEPKEAWQVVTDYAKAELASVRLTELDEFQYLPLAWWVRDEQQVVTDLVATDFNADTFDIDLDPTKIRNAIKVSFTETESVEYNPDLGGFQTIYELDAGSQISIPPGVTVLKFTYGGTGILPTQAVTLWDNSPIGGTGLTQVTLNDVSDGTGTYATSGQIQVTFDAWDAGSATLRFVNPTGITWYLVNDADFSPLIIVGIPVVEVSTYVADMDATSIAARNERSLDVAAQVLQTQESARRLARVLKMNLRYAVPTIGADQQGVQVLANPLRQPGDLGVFRDDVTGVTGGLWRLRGVNHQGDGAKYTQAIIARKQLPIMIIGEGVIGESLIGPRQD